jgi:4-hydroxy-tetrahydrodipicolinate synthase
MSSLRGVIAAAATPITPGSEPDLSRFVVLCRRLLDSGCDGLNICGTTGEATSLTVAQRMSIMTMAARELPLDRLMVGTGAAASGDAIALTRCAAELGFAGALIIPPFYYKQVTEDGIVRLFAMIVAATAQQAIPLYLYNFPALSGVIYTPDLVSRLLREFGERIAGLKDSSGDIDYAKRIAALSPKLQVFPSNEAVLLRARDGEFAGCISATANVNSEFCARAFRAGDEEALAVATKIRALLSAKPLIPSVKAMLSYKLDDQGYEAVLLPLVSLSEVEKRQLVTDVGPLLS